MVRLAPASSSGALDAGLKRNPTRNPKMKLTPHRLEQEAPPEVLKALFVLGHWLAKTGPDLSTNFDITEGDEVVQYYLEMKEVKRYPWLIEGDTLKP